MYASRTHFLQAQLANRSSPVEHADEPALEIVADELKQLKEAAIAATANADVSFYDEYLSDDALGVTPAGVFNKQQILDGMAQGNKFKSSRIDDTQVKVIGFDAGLVTYRATFDNPNGTTFDVFVSTLYKRTHQGWKGVVYQQTPMPSRTPIKCRAAD